MKYDIIIVGSGFAGSTIAYKAAKAGKKVLVIEKRNHIAGNMYDYMDENGLLIQKYGIHSFHTNSEDVYKFIQEIGNWKDYTLKARVIIDGKATPSPFNLKTVDDFFSSAKAEEIKKHMKMVYGEQKKTTIVEMLYSDDEVIREYAEFLFEKDYKPYTVKQWNIEPDELDVSILKRVPVRLDYTDAYFDDKYQLIPENGFTEIFENMLLNPLIEVRTSCDALKLIQIKDNNIYFEGEHVSVPIVYTGAIDELFNYKYGKLPYRSLYFDYQTFNMDSYQETPGVVYPIGKDFTRITEFKKLSFNPPSDVTTVAFEYSVEYESENGKEAYYPVLTEKSNEAYRQYLGLSENISNLYLCGRLADFKYYNMDNVIERALEVYDCIF